MSPALSDPFSRDMNRILDRVYRSELCPRVSPQPSDTVAELERAREAAQALEDSLQGLRDLRERSQGLTAVREEIEDLRQHILALRAMGEEITVLRLKLAEPMSPVARCAQVPAPMPLSGPTTDGQCADADLCGAIGTRGVR